MKKTFAIILVGFGLLAAMCSINMNARERADAARVSRNVRIFTSALQNLNEMYVDSLDVDDLTRQAIDYMLYQIDPYTSYYSEDELEEYTSIASGHYGGIGCVISKIGDSIVAYQPHLGKPAHNFGLRHGDRFVEIDGHAITSATTTSDASKWLRGDPHTTVEVKIQRPYCGDSVLTIAITRDEIQVDPMPYYAIDDRGIGYINTTGFDENLAKNIETALTEMMATGNLKGLILDLRDNPGGLLESAVQIVSLFVPKGTEVVRIQGFDATDRKVYKSTRKPIAPELPLVVLINNGSASASEIVAGSLQDLDRAVIIGSRSFGKGLVQTSRRMPYNGVLKVTSARYYIPSGRLIQVIDYSHRDDDGNPLPVPDSLRKEWRTANGRIVLDGGGISPDIVAEDSTMNSLLYNVVSGNWTYRFATYFATANGPELAADWRPDSAVFENFKRFLDPETFNYDRLCDLGLDYLRRAAVAEGYDNDSVRAAIDALAGMMRHDLDHDLDFNRHKLIPLLDHEISQRYFSEGECVRRMLCYDLVYDTACAVILDPQRYRRILSPAVDK